MVENFVDLTICYINSGHALSDSDGEASLCTDRVSKVVFVVYHRDGKSEIYFSRSSTEVGCDFEGSIRQDCDPIDDVVIWISDLVRLVATSLDSVGCRVCEANRVLPLPHTEAETSIDGSLSHIKDTYDWLGNDVCERTRVQDLRNEAWLRFANLVYSGNRDAGLKGPIPGINLRNVSGTNPEAQHTIVGGNLERIWHS